MLKGFKDFLLRGNVVDLAVAVVVGAAFTAVVTAFTNAFLKPLIQVVSGGGEFAGTFRVRGVEFDYASFVNAVITFLITAAVIYFLVVLPLKVITERRRRGEEAGPADPTDVELLTEIRDLLRAQQSSGAPSSSTPRTERRPDDDPPEDPGDRIPTQDR
jgi:large conductance mechanosensitive channel